jgi:predicted oxidoreductase
MDAEETAHALERALLSGKARSVGVSNFRPSQIELLASKLKTTLRTNQIEFSPLHLDPLNDGSLDLAQRMHFHPQVWSPVGGGRLLSGTDERTTRTRNKLAEAAQGMGLPGPAEAALAWVARHPSRPLPILGSGRRERVEGALAALTMTMDRQTWYDIWRTSIGEPVP